MENFEAAVIGLYVELGPEECLHTHKSTFNYPLSQLVITCTHDRHTHSIHNSQLFSDVVVMMSDF